MRRPVEVEQAQEAVVVGSQRTQEFGDPSLGATALHLHLEEAVLCMGITEPEVSILGRPGMDVGYAPFIAQDVDGPGDTFDSDRAVNVGKGGPEPEVETGAGDGTSTA